MTDIEIAQRAKLEKINMIAEKAGLAEELKTLDGNDMKRFIEITKKQSELGRLEF